MMVIGMGVPAEESWKSINLLSSNLVKSIGENKFECLKLLNAGHLDQEDVCMYD